MAQEDALRVIQLLHGGHTVQDIAAILGVTSDEVVATLSDPEGSSALPGGSGGGGTLSVGGPAAHDIVYGELQDAVDVARIVMLQVGLVAPAPADSASVQALIDGLQVGAIAAPEGPAHLTETLTFVVPAFATWQINEAVAANGETVVGSCHVQAIAVL